jgi:hypothetical protein
LRSSITLKNLFLFFISLLFSVIHHVAAHPKPFDFAVPAGVLKGFLIIPKKVEQNQTKVFDRDKPTLGRNFTVPNAISDFSKGSSSFKVVKGATNSSSSSSSGLSAAPAAPSNSSSNQLNGSAEVESETIFTTANFTNITAQVGSIVEIPCTVLHLGEGTVSQALCISTQNLVDGLNFQPNLLLQLSGPVFCARPQSSKCIEAFGIAQQVVEFERISSHNGFMAVSQWTCLGEGHAKARALFIDTRNLTVKTFRNFSTCRDILRRGASVEAFVGLGDGNEEEF